MQTRQNPDAPIGTPLSFSDSSGNVVIFNNKEHPEKLEFPVEQRLAVSELLGGQRVVQSMGVQPQPIFWEGKLFDQNVMPRIKALLALAKNGTPVTLQYLSFAFNVVISKFIPRFHNEWYGEYEITCEVVSDASGSITTPNVPSIDSVIANLHQQALTQFNTINALSPLIPAETVITLPSTVNMSGITSAINTLGPFTSASQGSITSLTALINNSLSALTSYNNSVNAGINSGTYTMNMLTAFSSGQNMANNLSSLLSTISTGQNPLQQQYMGGNLYKIASEVYGDPSLFNLLKTANNLSSSILPSGTITTLIIPPNPGSN